MVVGIWYIFPEIGKTISWEGHLAGFITGFVLQRIQNSKLFEVTCGMNGKKPNFDTENDPFGTFLTKMVICKSAKRDEEC